MPRKQGEVEKSLEAKGFQRPKGGDHNYFHYYSLGGKKTAVFTKTSHGAREIDDSLLARMARQCKLARGDFDRLIDCPLDRNSYEAKLVEQGLVETRAA
jgi:predicted RNA binding protein YcfA (HicA-like mRNA interferase family)